MPPDAPRTVPAAPLWKAKRMTRTTRQAVEALLPPGATIDDLSDQEISALFEVIVQQADGAKDGLSASAPGNAAAHRLVRG